MVLDMVVTDHLGFVGDCNRINGGMTRCRDGIVMVGDIDAMRTINRKRMAHLLSVINLFRRSCASHTVKVGGCR